MKKILVSTTESLQGWEIESYLRPVFSNVVLGAGFMSDFSASWTDFFGGRSNSYEKKLQALNDNALGILMSKASEIGANCIVGLKVNMDQVSGKNVQMFMVSAYGTAVVAKSLTVAKPINSLKEADKSTIEDKTLLIKILNKLKNGNPKLEHNHLQLIIESKCGEFKSYLFEKYKALANSSSTYDADVFSQNEQLYFEYFGAIDSTEASDFLYEALSTETDEKIKNKILTILRLYDLLDYEKTLSLLRSASLAERKLALTLLMFNKPYYVPEDIGIIQQIKNEIPNTFQNISTSSTKKGFLSSSEKEIWVCTCGKSNDIETKYCFDCQKDQFGFKADELKPSDVADHLNNKSAALEEFFIKKQQ